MSLLLEALKRAEVDFKNRKKAAADGQDFSSSVVATSPQPQQAPAPASTPANRSDAPKIPVLATQLEPIDFPELYLADIEPPAVKARANTPAPTATPEALVKPSVVPPNSQKDPPPPPALSPLAAIAANKDVSSSVPPHAVQAPIYNAQASIPIAPATPRQALTAAAVLAGAKQKKLSIFGQRRTSILASLALLLALPLIAFLIWGDQLLHVLDKPIAAKPPLTYPVAVNAQVTPTQNIAPQDTPQVAIATQTTPATTPTLASISSLSVPLVNLPEKAITPKKPRALPTQTSLGSGPAQRTSPESASNSLSVIASTPKPASAMESAYASYQAGKTEDAARQYREVLKNDPTQPDAWLGLAVIAHANNQREPAMNAYKRVLRLEPQNPTALAGVNSLNNNSANEPRQESNLRELLARSPQEADLNHALGVVLSGERRWSEAQPLFFKAHALSPQEPQYAYNLAVTLDQLRKPSLAAQYYETALTLAQGKANAFDVNSARARLAALKLAALPKTTP